MQNIIDFITWGLTHAKRSSVPSDAQLLIPLTNVGSGGEWEYLYGTTGRKATQALLDKKYNDTYKGWGWNRAQFDDATKGWVEKGVTVCDCQGLEDYFSASDTNAQGNYDKYCTSKGKIVEISRAWVIGEAVFRHNGTKIVHVGWVCGFMPDGDPCILEERGLTYGCVVTRLSKRDFTHRGLMTNRYVYGDAEQSEAPEASLSMQGIHAMITGNVNVRRGPDTSYPIICVAHKGDMVLIIPQADAWPKIAVVNDGNFVCGYASDKYIQAATNVQDPPECIDVMLSVDGVLYTGNCKSQGPL